MEEEAVMQDATKTHEVLGQFAGKTIATMTVWADTNQRVLRELVDLSADTAKEGLRLYSELSRNAIEVLKEGQEGAFRWQSGMRGTGGDPAAWSQKLVTETTQYTQQTFRRAEESMQALTRTAERLQTIMEQAGKGVQESLAGAVGRLKSIYGSPGFGSGGGSSSSGGS
jgi:hypothetical protein